MDPIKKEACYKGWNGPAHVAKQYGHVDHKVDKQIYFACYCDDVLGQNVCEETIVFIVVMIMVIRWLAISLYESSSVVVGTAGSLGKVCGNRKISLRYFMFKKGFIVQKFVMEFLKCDGSISCSNSSDNFFEQCDGPRPLRT
ncbi:hypothetical protein ACOSQ2_021629 [Xanthoceras sorbifolium]